ncbi:MAG: hypothetical protein AAF518_09845 [Spirochaetota bacterium]
MQKEKIIDPLNSGYLIFCFKKLRDIALIELRQGFNQEYDNVLNFYLDQMDSSIYSKNIDLKEFERIRALAKNYVEYEIHYSFADVYEIKNEIQDQFDYILLAKVSNLIKDYNLCKFDFFERNSKGNFILLSEIEDLIEVYKEECEEVEIGSFSQLLANPA